MTTAVVDSAARPKLGFYQGVRKINEILCGRVVPREATDECLELLKFFEANAGEPYSMNRRWIARMLLQCIGGGGEKWKPDLREWVLSREPVTLDIRNLCDDVTHPEAGKGGGIDSQYYACLALKETYPGAISAVYGQFIHWPDDATLIVFRECAEYMRKDRIG